MGAESKIKIKNDGSGSILFSYRISRMLLEMGESMDETGDETLEDPEEEADSNVPLPITKEDFETSVEGIEGLELVDVTQEETEQDVIITAELKFDDVEALSTAEAFSEWPVTFAKDGNSYIFTQVISEGVDDNAENAMDEETISMVESMFQGYEFSFSVEAPSSIKEYSIGELSTDKKTVTYTVPIADMMRIKEKLELIIKW
jgi:hypothetical protein